MENAIYLDEIIIIIMFNISRRQVEGIVKHPFNEKLLLATRKFEETLARFELIFTLITCITYGQNCISPGKL
ncbi:unnamed protein product [Brassica oleracea var. botrytis]